MNDVSVRDLPGRIGQEVGVSDWFEVTQARIDAFAEATSDHQWIHVDPARAAIESPYKTTIAHGFLTLSLLVPLFADALRIGDVRLAINYGLDRLRFIAPVPAGSRIRARFTPLKVVDVTDAVQVTWVATVEREHGDKPCVVAEWIVRYYV